MSVVFHGRQKGHYHFFVGGLQKAHPRVVVVLLVRVSMCWLILFCGRRFVCLHLKLLWLAAFASVRFVGLVVFPKEQNFQEISAIRRGHTRWCCVAFHQL